MKDEKKTREQLLSELESLSREFAESKKAETECRWIEAALRDSEERYRRLLESITDYIYTVRVENGHPVSTTHGPGCLAVTGYTSEYLQIYPRLWYEMIYEEDRKSVLKQAERIISGEVIKPIEHRITHKDGSIRWVRNTPVPHFDRDGKLIAYDGIIEDITERRMAAEALSESEEKFRTIATSANDAIVMMGGETNISYWNPAAERIFGYSKEEALRKRLHELIVPMGQYEGFSKGFKMFQESGKGPIIGKTLELASIRKDGSEFYAEHSIAAVKVKGKWNAIGIIRDVSDRKKAEEALRASREYARSVIESSMDMIIAVDKDRNITEFNRAAQETFGYGLEEVLGKHVDMLYADPSEGLMVHDVTLENGRHLQEIANRRKNGQLFPSLLSSSVLRNAQGGIIGVMGVSHDITRRKRDEEALKESFANIERAKKEWEATFDGITDPLFIHDKELNVVRANRAYQEMAGIKFEEFIGKPYYEVFPKMEKPFRICLKALELREEEEEEEFSCPLTNRIFKVRFYPIKDVNGGYLYSIHILEDITEAKRSAERIKEEIEITTHLLMIADATAHITDADRLMEQVVHCSHEIIGCDICLSYLWDEEAKIFQPCQEFGLSHDMIPLFRTERIDENIEFVRKAVERKEPVVGQVGAGLAPAARKGQPQGLPLQWLPDINSIAAIPLIGKTGTLGLIVCIYLTPTLTLHPLPEGEGKTPAPSRVYARMGRGAGRGWGEGAKFTERDMKIMRGIMNQVSVALEQARFYKESVDKTLELSHKIETIKVMHEIDRSILSTLKADEVLETVTRLISKVISCERVTVSLVDTEQGGFIYKAGFGTAVVPKGAFVPFADTSARVVIETGRTEYINNLSEMTPLLPLEKRFLDEGFFSHIRVPITIKGDVAGILTVGAKRVAAFTHEDLSTLEKMASQIGVALSNARLITDLEEFFIGVVKSLSSAIDAKSPWTSGHSERVTKYALDIAKEMGLSSEDIRALEVAGLLHDIGKIATYDILLDKPGKLEPDEIEIVRRHPGKGAEILEPIMRFGNIIPAIKHHHEFYDGTGYPDRLKGEDIPLLARILTVADTFDAMSADRPYRTGRTMEFMISELKRCSGTQFDPKVVEAFLKTLNQG